MFISRSLKLQFWRRLHLTSRAYHFRRLDLSNRRRSGDDAVNAPSVQPQKLSLLAEFFPEETTKDGVGRRQKDREVPRLPLPEVDEFLEEFQDEFGPDQSCPKSVTKTAAANAFKQHQLAVLVLQIASKSLVDSDFRRIAPKGKHINGWTGPGDILKVIPGRDLQTLEHAGYYLILFPNPAYARAYQSHVIRLQRVARTYTPTSVESPLPLQPGMIIEGEDVYALLQDYALCPPSQRLQLKILPQPYATGTKSVLQKRGYRQIVEGIDKTARAVLFWIDGHQLTAALIKNAIAADGRDQGLAWNVLVEKVDTSLAANNGGEDPGVNGYEGSAELRPYRYEPTRWILTFADENEARRFIRTWHRRRFPLSRGGEPSLVHTELLW